MSSKALNIQINQIELNNMEGAVFAGQFNNNKTGHITAANFLTCFEFLVKTINLPEEVWALIDNVSINERKDIIKKQKKRQVKKAAKFTPNELEKPKRAIDLFRIDFKNKCKAEGKEYNKDIFSEAWSEISDEDKDRYTEMYKQATIEYKAETERLRLKAIEDGEWTADKPKNARSGYILFNNMLRMKGNKFMTQEEYNKIAGMKMSDQAKARKPFWDALKENEDQTDYERVQQMAAQEKMYCAVQMYKWNIHRLECAIKKAERDEDTVQQEKLKAELESFKEDDSNMALDMNIQPVSLEWCVDVSTTTTNESEHKTKSKKSKAKSKAKVKTGDDDE